NESRRAYHARGRLAIRQRRRHQFEGAAGHAAAAGLLARMRRIEERHARAALREPVRRPRSRRSRADDRDVCFSHAVCVYITAMIDASTGLFTIGVFQDVAWATKALDALKQAGFAAESLSILAKDGDAAKLIEKVLGNSGSRVESAGVGTIVGRGPL